MKIKKAFGIFLSLSLFTVSTACALTPVKDSAEDLFWTDPMTVHDYKKDTDLHNVAVSAMAITELEFVRLGDGLLDLTTKNKKSPIAKSLDSLEYSYSKLPRVEPVRRFGQFWDALQLRQLSLSDARLVGSVLIGDSMGGITPIMQVRAYKLTVWVEDIIYDLDHTVMFPFNWGISAISKKSSDIKSLGYAADGLGFLRWNISAGLKLVNREVVRASSKLVTGLEKPFDVMERKKRKKRNEKVLIFSKMPLSVFLKNQSYFLGKKKTVFVGTLSDWHKRFYLNPDLLPDNIRQEDFLAAALPLNDLEEEVIMAAEYRSWEKTSRELKRYVITQEEVVEAIQQYKPLASP